MSFTWSIKKFVTAARRYRTVTIQAGDHAITAADWLAVVNGLTCRASAGTTAGSYEGTLCSYA